MPVTPASPFTAVRDLSIANPAGGETVSPILLTGGAACTSGLLRLAYFTAAANDPVNNLIVSTAGTAAGATPTLVRFGLWLIDAAGAGTLVASTPNDTALLAATTTVYTKAVSSAYTLVRGSRYAFGVLVVTGATAPTLACTVASSGHASLLGSTFSTAKRRTGQISGLSDIGNFAVGAVADEGRFVYGAWT